MLRGLRCGNGKKRNDWGGVGCGGGDGGCVIGECKDSLHSADWVAVPPTLNTFIDILLASLLPCVCFTHDMPHCHAGRGVKLLNSGNASFIKYQGSIVYGKSVNPYNITYFCLDILSFTSYTVQYD